MALPSSWGTVRVYGTFTLRTGDPAVGSVVFHSPQIVVVDGVTVVPRNIVCELDSDGFFEYDLPATDDADIAPDGWVYTVRERFDGGGGRAAYNISAPLAGGDINLATVAPALAVDAQSTLELWQLADVADAAETPSTDDVLTWDGSQWVAASAQSVGGGSGDVVGPASATDDRIAAFDGVTGKLIKQGSVTATAVASHLGSTSNPHSVTAAQVGADPTGTAAAAVVAHTGATDPHGDRSFATSAVSTHAGAVDPHGDRAYADGLAGNYATAGHDHTGVYQPLATVLTNTTAAFTTAQETKLGGIEALADVTDAGNVGAAIDGATVKTTPVDADTVALIDSAAGNALKKLSWANIKATAKTYFDTLYQAASATLTTWAGITPGTGIATALGTNVGTAGSMVTNGGALGTPSSATLTNATGLPLFGLAQSSATTGQVPTWNGSAYAPATPTSGGANINTYFA